MFSSSKDQTSREKLLAEVKVKIGQLESAIAQVSSVKHNLHQNACEIKSQIHTTISRQLETLRNREVWLLSQVEVIEQLKEDVLRKQQAEFNQELGGLRNSLDYTSERQGSDVDYILSECLDKINKLELFPAETPCISFRADQAALRDNIQKFGKVEAQGIALETAFVGSNTLSTTLPRHFEDYEIADQQHNILYKTVEQLRHIQDPCIYVTIPKLSIAKEDWLMKGGDTRPKVSTTPVCSFPPFQSNNYNWLFQATNTDDGSKQNAPKDSIRHWLQQIQHGAEEEEEFELIETSSGPSRSATFESFEALSSQLSKSEGGNPAKCVEAYFRDAQAKPMSHWLVSTDLGDISTKPYETWPYFSEEATSTANWLYSDKNDKESCGGGTCGGPCIKSRPMEIENIVAFCPRDPVSQYFRDMKNDKRTWVKEMASDQDSDESDYVMPQIQDVCKASQPCQSFSECCSGDSCRQDLEKWLQRPSPARVTPFGPFQDAIYKSDWLLETHDEPISEVPSSLFPCFQNQNKTPSDWLLDKQSDVGKMDTEDSNCLDDESINISSTEKWLIKTEPKVSDHDALSSNIAWDKVKEFQSEPKLAWVKLSEDTEKNDDDDDTKNLFNIFRETTDNERWLSAVEGDQEARPVEEMFGYMRNQGRNLGEWLYDQDMVM